MFCNFLMNMTVLYIKKKDIGDYSAPEHATHKINESHP